MPSPVSTIALITTCKGRLHHLQQTLPLTAAQAPGQLIVVDYDCPNGTAAWVEAELPSVAVVRAGQPDGRFNVSRARNLGAAQASAEWLVFIDADIRVAPDMLERVRPLLEPGTFLTARATADAASAQVWGTFACPREAFVAVEGYDEILDAWGHEDEDLYLRLQAHGLRRGYLPPGLVSPIEHDDSQRNVSAHDRWENEAANACYAMAKREISRLLGGGGNLPLDDRRKIMAHSRKVVAGWYANGARDTLPVNFKLSQSAPLALASRMRVSSAVTVTVILEPRTEQRRGSRRRKSAKPGQG